MATEPIAEYLPLARVLYLSLLGEPRDRPGFSKEGDHAQGKVFFSKCSKKKTELFLQGFVLLSPVCLE